MDLQEIDLSKLYFNEIGSWPFPTRIIALAIIALLAIAGGYFLFINQKLTALNLQHNKQISLRKEFRDKYHKASNLEAYKEQMKEMKKTLRELLRQLPTEGRVPSLNGEYIITSSSCWP